MPDNTLQAITEALSNYAGETVDKFYNDPAFGLYRFLEYKRQNLWIIYHKDIPAWLVTSAERPKVNLGQTKKIKFINTHEKLANGQGEWMPIKLTLHDAIVPSASYLIYNQIRKQWEYNKARVGYKADYVMNDLQLRLVDPNGAVTETWIFHEAFLTGDVDFNSAGLDYDNFKRLKITVTLDYSWAELITGGTP